ncbi:aminopeptidase [Latilactobacillus sakei]
MANITIETLEKLSNADGIASCEQEVRDVIKASISEHVDDISYDGLGSLIATKQGQPGGPKIMICAHMDEVGFIVRSISTGGLIQLMVVGGVKLNAQQFQKLRVTTQTGAKISGIVCGEYDKTAASKLYLDVGATSAEDVAQLGIQIGDMVTYATPFESFDLTDIYAGKALDDRLGCFIMTEIAKRLADESLESTIQYAATSSEEVGIRGAKTAVYTGNPDVVFVIDVACFPDEYVRDHTNNRQIGKGMMLTHFDRTLAPNRQLIKMVKETAQRHQWPLQLDMFNNGGTDGGEAHKVNEGKPTVVTCLPCRYGHCAYSMIDMKDIEDCISIYVDLLKNFHQKDLQNLLTF